MAKLTDAERKYLEHRLAQVTLDIERLTREGAHFGDARSRAARAMRVLVRTRKRYEQELGVVNA